MKSLAEAYVHQDTAWPRLITDDGRAVGFVMAFLDIDWTGDGTGRDVRSGLWRLLVDAREQGRGYGRFAVAEVAAGIHAARRHPDDQHMGAGSGRSRAFLRDSRLPPDRGDQRGPSGR